MPDKKPPSSPPKPASSGRASARAAAGSSVAAAMSAGRNVLPASQKGLKQTIDWATHPKAAFLSFRRLLQDDVVTEDVLADEEAAKAAFLALIKKVNRRSYVIGAFLITILLLIPVLKPLNYYEAMKPDKQTKYLVPLTAPNLTDHAILSWSATAITEILTFGFGDFDQRILQQRSRFTDEGWTSFTKAIRNQDLRANFKSRQLVLTTVPSNTPLIVFKGQDIEGESQWIVEMPIIMTYSTNNNVTERHKGLVRLTIVRVPGSQNISGIGIKNWILQG